MVLSPITGLDDVSLLKKINTQKLIDDWQKTFQIDITKELHGHIEIELYRCNQSGLRFFVPFDLAGSEQLYRDLQKFSWFYLAEKWEYEVALANLSNCRTVLEVGCGFGAFIQKGINASLDIVGIELNALAVATAHQNNLPVVLMNLDDFGHLHAESIDAVCCFQVLEHIPDPMSFLEDCLKVLKLGGKMILAVPNSDSFLQHQYNLLDMPPHHMTQWSEATFRALESYLPIKLEQLLCEPLMSYHVPAYVSAYADAYAQKYNWARFLQNRYLKFGWKLMLHLGLRHFLTGQSLYIQFIKV